MNIELPGQPDPNVAAAPKVNKHYPREVPWFADKLPLYLRAGEEAMPNKIIKARNWALAALFVQFLSTVAGYLFFMYRRTRIYLVVNSINLIILAYGADGVLSFKKWQIATHGVLTCGILGIFFLYSLLEAFVRKNLGEGEDLHYSERATMMLLSMPYLFDFCAGCFTFYLTYLIFDDEEQKKGKGPQNFQELHEDIRAPEGYDLHNSLCCVCMERQKNTVIYNCGHQALCVVCAQMIKEKKKRCPICRSEVRDIIVVYD